MSAIQTRLHQPNGPAGAPRVAVLSIRRRTFPDGKRLEAGFEPFAIGKSATSDAQHGYARGTCGPVRLVQASLYCRHAAQLSAKHIVRTDRSLPCSFGKLRRAPVPLLRDGESVNICGSTEVFVDVSCSDAVPVMPE